ncbi:MAG: hypothetical protein AAB790_02945 [Patescibacteria group bacterium]
MELTVYHSTHENVIELDTPAVRTLWHILATLWNDVYRLVAVVDDFENLLRNRPTPWFDKNPEWREWVFRILEWTKTWK